MEMQPLGSGHQLDERPEREGGSWHAAPQVSGLNTGYRLPIVTQVTNRFRTDGRGSSRESEALVDGLGGWW